MTAISYNNGTTIDPAVIQIWDDLYAQRPAFRAFWCASSSATTGSPVIGYCSSGGSHRTIRATVAEVRRLGYSDPIYRNGKLIKS